MKLFEVALRNKYRFSFKGLITVEDLWDLSLENLDQIYGTLHKQLKQGQEETLLKKKDKTDVELENKLEILKYIVETKQTENAALLASKDIKEHNQKILALIAEKKDAEMKGKGIEELEALLK